MKPHQERVVQERRELDEKRGKLGGFIGSQAYLSLPGAEQERLVRQSKIMDAYSCVLFERIATFEI